MARLKLPFELEKPSPNEYVTQASQIGHGEGDVEEALEALEALEGKFDKTEETVIVEQTNIVLERSTSVGYLQSAYYDLPTSYKVYIKAAYEGEVRLYYRGNNLIKTVDSIDLTNGAVIDVDYPSAIEDTQIGVRLVSLTDSITVERVKVYTVTVEHDALLHTINQLVEDVEEIKGDIDQLEETVDNVEESVGEDYIPTLTWVDDMCARDNQIYPSSTDKTSEPFLLKKGQTINVSTKGNGNHWYYVISEVDSLDASIVAGTSVTSLVVCDSRPIKTYTYTAQEDMCVIVTVLDDETSAVSVSAALVPKTDALERQLNAIVPTVNRIDRELYFTNEIEFEFVDNVTAKPFSAQTTESSIIETTTEKTSEPFLLKKGQSLTVKTKGNGNYWFNVLSEVSSLDIETAIGVTCTQIIKANSNALTTYTYTAADDIILIVTVSKDSTSQITVGGETRFSKIEELEKRLDEDEAEQSVSIYDPLRGKKWCVCGDSYTWGDFGHFTHEYQEGYQLYDDEKVLEDGPYKGERANYGHIIGNRYNMNIVMNAACGACMANNGFSVNDPSAAISYRKIPSDSDFITIAFGLNEIRNETEMLYPIGDETSSDSWSIWGAYNRVFEYIKTNMPNAKVGVILMDGWMTETYRTLCKRICQYWGIEVLDMFEHINSCLVLPLSGSVYDNMSTTAVDLQNGKYNSIKAATSLPNNHPNRTANYARANLIAEWLKTL